MNMQFATRKPSGIQSSPVILLAGIAGAGKTWAAVEATSVEEVDRAFFIEIGEGVADAYGAVPGADFEIIEHDGTIGQLRAAITWASQQPAAEGKYNMLILDSLTEVWDLLKDNAAATMLERVRQKKRRLNGAEPKPDMDLWNRAGEVSDGIMRQLSDFPGPVICTARLDEIAEVDGARPTGAKEWKIQVQKKVPYRVSAIVEARSPRTWHLTKIVSTNPNLQVEPGELKPLEGFTVSKLMEAMQVKPGAPGSTMVEPTVDGSLGDSHPAQNQRQTAQQHGNAPASQQRPANPPMSPEARKQELANYAQHLLEAEQQGDRANIEKALNFYSQHGDREKVQLARTTIDRMDKAETQKAQQQAREALDRMSQEPPATEAQQPSEEMANAMEVVQGELVEN